MTASTITTTDDRPATTVRQGKAQPMWRRLLLLIAVIVGMVGIAGPASAAGVQPYASSTVNGMWHSGSTQFYNSNTKFSASVFFNDVAGDPYCTQLKMRAHQSNGLVGTFTVGSVCGGRSGTLPYTITAAAGTRLTTVDIWTVRADGRVGSYVWTF